MSSPVCFTCQPHLSGGSTHSSICPLASHLFVYFFILPSFDCKIVHENLQGRFSTLLLYLCVLIWYENGFFLFLVSSDGAEGYGRGERGRGGGEGGDNVHTVAGIRDVIVFINFRPSVVAAYRVNADIVHTNTHTHIRIHARTGAPHKFIATICRNDLSCLCVPIDNFVHRFGAEGTERNKK